MSASAAFVALSVMSWDGSGECRAFDHIPALYLGLLLWFAVANRSSCIVPGANAARPHNISCAAPCNCSFSHGETHSSKFFIVLQYFVQGASAVRPISHAEASSY